MCLVSFCLARCLRKTNTRSIKNKIDSMLENKNECLIILWDDSIYLILWSFFSIVLHLLFILIPSPTARPGFEQLYFVTMFVDAMSLNRALQLRQWSAIFYVWKMNANEKKQHATRHCTYINMILRSFAFCTVYPSVLKTKPNTEKRCNILRMLPLHWHFMADTELSEWSLCACSVLLVSVCYFPTFSIVHSCIDIESLSWCSRLKCHNWIFHLPDFLWFFFDFYLR